MSAKKKVEVANEVENEVAAVETPKAKMIELTADQQKTLDGMSTTSAKIRYMAHLGHSTEDNKYGAIARFLNIRTQHVRNVLTQPLKRTA